MPTPSPRARLFLFLTLMLVTSAALAAGADPAAVVGGDVGGAVDDSLPGRLKAALASGNLFVAAALTLVGGFLTALSPCVYPLIPITLSILGARQAGSASKGFLLAGTYVLGMVVLYTTLGVGFAWAGMLAGSALQSPVLTIGVALFCIVMAASMFGAFELVLPSSLQTRLSQAGGGGFKGAFIMGLVAGVIAAPCTGPVLSFVLTLIARDRDVVKGGTLMFFYALGMGLPFLVLGTFSQAIARMPKSGKWMETVKSVFGLLMLGAGLYYLQIGIPAVADAMSPLGARGHVIGPVLIIVGIAVGALHLSFKYSPVAEKVRKGIGVAAATVGVVAFLAWTNAAPEPVHGGEIAWVKIGDGVDGLTRFDAAVASAKAAGKPVMIDFGADWCIACKELEKYTFVDATVRDEAARFVTIKVDATNETDSLKTIQERFGVVGLPTIAFIGGGDDYLDANKTPKHAPITGFLKAPEFLPHMQRVQ